MMHGIAQDFVKYVMHAQVTVAQPPPEAGVSNLRTSGPDDPSSGGATLGPAAAAQAALDSDAPAPEQAEEEVVNVPVRKSEWDKTPRNAPCPCGSGKKFKMCHGR
jgi:preprotein translocase subunit SecA